MYFVFTFQLEKFKNDPAFIEYMEVHGKGDCIWSNNDVEGFVESQKNTSQEHLDSGVENDAEPEAKPKKLAEDTTLSDADVG